MAGTLSTQVFYFQGSMLVVHRAETEDKLCKLLTYLRREKNVISLTKHYKNVIQVGCSTSKTQVSTELPLSA